MIGETHQLPFDSRSSSNFAHIRQDQVASVWKSCGWASWSSSVTQLEKALGCTPSTHSPRKLATSRLCRPSTRVLLPAALTQPPWEHLTCCHPILGGTWGVEGRVYKPPSPVGD